MQPTVEAELKALRKELREIRSLLTGRHIEGNWVKQSTAMAMLNVGARQLNRLRIAVNESGVKTGCIRWRKGNGRTTHYCRADIEAYLNKITIA